MQDVEGITVEPESPRSADAVSLIARLTAELRTQYTEAESRAVFAPEDAEQTGGAFLIARSGDGLAIGCVALRPLEVGVGEVKRMFVAPDWRGRKVGRLLLEAIEAAARERGYARLVLETGVRQTEAIALYERSGYEHIPAYGHYVGNAISVCFAKDLR